MIKPTNASRPPERPRSTDTRLDETAHSPISREPRDTGRRLRGAIGHRLGAAIVSGEYQPGDILQSEAQLSNALDVSRTALREAIRSLAAKGLVESRPRAGTCVLPRARWNLLDPDVLTWAFTSEPDPALVRALFELRALVEPGAAAMAAERRERGDVKAMRNALAAMARYGLNTEAGRSADRVFHHAMLQATGNEYLGFLSTSIGTAVSMTTQFKQRLKALPRDPIPDHRNVLDAIADGDPVAASAAMRVLVDLALDDMRKSME